MRKDNKQYTENGNITRTYSSLVLDEKNILKKIANVLVHQQSVQSLALAAESYGGCMLVLWGIEKPCFSFGVSFLLADLWN